MKHFFILIFPLFIFSCSGDQSNNVLNSSDSLVHTNNNSVDSIIKKDSLASTSSRPLINTIDEMAKLVFEAVKSNSIEDYINLLPTTEEINSLISAAILDAQTKEKSIKEFPEKRKEEIEKAKKRFAETVKMAIDSAGIIWKETKYFVAKTSVQMTPAGFEQANDISVIFTFKNKYYEFRLADCVKTPFGWRVSARIRYDGEPDNPMK